MKISIHHNIHFVTYKRNYPTYQNLITFENNNPTKLDNHNIYLDRHQHLWNILYNTNI